MPADDHPADRKTSPASRSVFNQIAHRPVSVETRTEPFDVFVSDHAGHIRVDKRVNRPLSDLGHLPLRRVVTLSSPKWKRKEHI